MFDFEIFIISHNIGNSGNSGKSGKYIVGNIHKSARNVFCARSLRKHSSTLLVREIRRQLVAKFTFIDE